MTKAPKPFSKMAGTLSSIYRKGTDFFTPTGSSVNLSSGAFATADNVTKLFTKVDPAVDGEDCEHDCESCTIHYPAKFSIDESDNLYGHVKGWATHLIVATGKTDWVRDVEDEKGSVMEAVGKSGIKPSNGRLMLSASNIPTPDYDSNLPASQQPTIVFLLPSFTILQNVTPDTVPDLLKHVVSSAPTNTTPLTNAANDRKDAHDKVTNTASDSTEDPANQPSIPPPVPLPSLPFLTTPIPHDALILLCSQKTRDARCGQSAPLLRREFERHLRPLGLYRDLQDTRKGGVGIYFISHVGGHKYSANVMVYRREGAFGSGGSSGSAAADRLAAAKNRTLLNGQGEEGADKQAAQCIWLARVRPEDCEGIIKFTVMQGKVVKPERQLRGGFDRTRNLVSW